MDTEQVQASQAEVGDRATEPAWPAKLYHADAYSWIAYVPRTPGGGVPPDTIYVLNKRNAEAPDSIAIPMRVGDVCCRRLSGVVASSQGRQTTPGDFCLVQVKDGPIQVLVANQEYQDVKPEISGPGRYNHREAFCRIRYQCVRTPYNTIITHIWNSRDGRVPETVTPYLDKLVYVREPGSEVCLPDNTPEAGSLVFTDGDNNGTPRVTVVTQLWLDQFKKKYANPQNTIKRLEGVIEAVKKRTEQMERDYKLLLADKDSCIGLCRREIGDQSKRIEILDKTLSGRADQINQQKNTIVEQSSEIARLKRFEQLAVDFSTAVNQTSGMLCSLVSPVKDFTPNFSGKCEPEHHPETFAG